MANKIYTKTGDKGTTSLIGGKKIPKSHLRIDAYGNVDELNSYIGLCRDMLTDEQNRTIILAIQDRLFTIGSSLASDPDKETKMKLPRLGEADILLLENEIDRMTDAIPPMRNFILPGGHVILSHIHIARCICRRAERSVVKLQIKKEEVEPVVLKYLNRLSDYLFILARFTGHQMGVEEIPWKPRNPI